MIFSNKMQCFFVLAVSIVAASVSNAWSDEAKGSYLDSESQNDLFEGMIVGFQVDQSTSLESKSRDYTLYCCRIVKLGDRFFVVGKSYVPDLPQYESYADQKDVVRGIAWDRVQYFAVFTEEQYSQRVDKWVDKIDSESDKE